MTADGSAGAGTRLRWPAGHWGLRAGARRTATRAPADTSASSPMLFTGLQGTPAASSAAIQCARVSVRSTAATIGISAALCFTRSRPRAKRGSSAHSG